jgi:hypothetical protein
MKTRPAPLSNREAALIEDALAAVRAKPAGSASADPAQAASDLARTIEMAVPLRAAQPQGDSAAGAMAGPTTGPQPVARHTVFAPADMKPELAARIALLMEQESDLREQRRLKRRRFAITIGVSGAALLLGIFAIALMSPGPRKAPRDPSGVVAPTTAAPPGAAPRRSD